MSGSPGVAAVAALGAVALILGGEERPAAAEGRGLSLAEAVQTALANDAELYIAREDARAAVEGISLARSAFAKRLFGEIYGTRTAQPPSATSFRTVDTIAAATVGIAGRIESGLTYIVSGRLTRQNLDDPFSTLYDAATTTTVHAEVVQPLWRGAFAAARRPIVVASLRRNRSEHELRARVEGTVGAVQVAYWNLVRARSERDARTSALELAGEQVEDSRRLQRLGTGSDLDVVEAEAGVSRRRQELLRTEQDVVEADGKLFEAIGVRAGEAGWDAGRAIVPTDAPQIEPLAAGVDAQIALARTRRADALAARDLIGAEAAELAVAADRRRASIDLVAAAGTAGFAGALASTYATAGVNGGGLDPMYATDPAYDGGIGSSLRNTVGRDLQLYLGLRFELPLGNHEAEVRHSIQQRTLARARLAERATLAQIESEVRTTVARIGVGAELVAAADRTVALSEKLLEGMRKRFRAGASTSFDVLRVSDELTRARVEAARARADYRASLTRLAAATGTLLEGLGISVDSIGGGGLGASPR
jgi:outer membrane protein TolC